MTTWATFRDTLLRPLLKDAQSLTDLEVTPKWTDAELLAYANLALADISGYAPRLSYATATGVDGTRTEFDLPTDMISLETVQVDTLVLLEYEVQPGQALPGTRQSIMYMVDWPEEGTLTFTKAPTSGSTVTIFYSAYRSSIVEETDAMPVDRHQWIEQAIALYSAFLAHLREGVGTASLEQWKGRQDLNVGNPLNLEAREFLAQYQRVIRDNRPREAR